MRRSMRRSTARRSELAARCADRVRAADVALAVAAGLRCGACSGCCSGVSVTPRLLRLAVRCPSCRQVPAIRVSREERSAKLCDQPTRLVLTYQCHRCGETYDITVQAFLQAG